MIDSKALLAEVKANIARLNSCDRHLFAQGDHIRHPRHRIPCRKCGGEMQLVDIGNYIRGYEAAGGDVNDVWPGYRDKRG